MIKKICENCNGEYEVYPVRKDTAKFCSYDCYWEDKKGKFAGKKNPQWVERIEIACEHCSKPFSMRETDKRKFCSVKCKVASQIGDKIKIKCLSCGIEFEEYPCAEGVKKYCSRECFYKGNTGENNHAYVPEEEKECDNCGSIFSAKPCYMKVRKFCSRDCFGEYNVGENNWNYIDGRKPRVYSKYFARQREPIKKRDDYTCQCCGITQEEHKNNCGFGLGIHHIDYNIDNNESENLITLCNLCNIKANHNRDYWINYYTEICQQKE